jgi:hypothetical protein
MTNNIFAPAAHGFFDLHINRPAEPSGDELQVLNGLLLHQVRWLMSRWPVSLVRTRLLAELAFGSRRPA